MRVYLLKDADFERLLAEIARDPKHGRKGGSSQVLSAADKKAFEKAHSFYNYVVRVWLDSVKGERES